MALRKSLSEEAIFDHFYFVLHWNIYFSKIIFLEKKFIARLAIKVSNMNTLVDS